MKIGFVGLGDMGLGIVPRLLAAGHGVTGWNRTKSKAEPLLKLGMGWADSPREAAARSEIVLSIVTDAAAVQAVALGDGGIIAGLKKGGVYLDMSTIAPDASRAVAAEFAKAGLAMLDAPISGSTVTLAEGKASIRSAATVRRSSACSRCCWRSGPRSPISAAAGWRCR
jgi:3-hydroxyisobutyrate dehydrogenase-like beta-hydroxyacid dehydrogenase